MSTLRKESVEKLLKSDQGRALLIDFLQKQSIEVQDNLSLAVSEFEVSSSETSRTHNLQAPIHPSALTFKPKRTPLEVLQELVPLAKAVSEVSAQMLKSPEHSDLKRVLAEATEALAPATEYEPTPYFAPAQENGDVLPQIGETVLIHLARQNEWVPHQVVGYFAWPSHCGTYSLSRLFIRVRDANGLTNARLLYDVLRMDKTPFLN